MTVDAIGGAPPNIQEDVFGFVASDGKEIQCYRWLGAGRPRAMVQIAHGMGEHAKRYRDIARRLVAAGYAVVANDHRGHGDTAGPEHLGDLGPGGWDRVIEDAFEINAHVGAQLPGVPRVLLGHSMGAMLTQQYVYRHGSTLQAVVISGSPGIGAALQLFVMHTIARFERARLGAAVSSPLLDRLVFGAANDPFEGDTGFEWLSRDAEQVRRYVEDPYCGFVLRTGGMCDLFAGAREARRKKSIALIPKTLPIYVFSGGADPVFAGTGLQRLEARYRKAGIVDLTVRLYEGGRHEMFNETNRDEVTDDLLAWLDGHVQAVRPA
jgi:alpha-beta hydrolase superfamily lysophospholipase